MAISANIKDRILKVEKVDWRKLLPLQPKNIKHIYNYAWIEESINKYGFAFPFAVWEDEDGNIYTVDGHTRIEVLETIEGVPDMLTAIFIDAKDKEEATRILLEVYNQKSNPLDQQVLMEWLEVEEIPVSEIAVESLNVIEVGEEEEEAGERPGSSGTVIKLEYTEEDYEQVRDALARVAQTPEAAVWELLGLDK